MIYNTGVPATYEVKYYSREHLSQVAEFQIQTRTSNIHNTNACSRSAHRIIADIAITSLDDLITVFV